MAESESPSLVPEVSQKAVATLIFPRRAVRCSAGLLFPPKNRSQNDRLSLLSRKFEAHLELCNWGSYVIASLVFQAHLELCDWIRVRERKYAESL